MRVERTETKYLVTPVEYGDLMITLPKLLDPDPHNGGFGYRVKSLYFDSFDDRDFYDKVDGLENRKKIRLRIYGNLEERVKLEIKIKENMFQAKDSMWIKREDAIRLQECDFACLDNYDDPLAEKLRRIMTWNNYRPVVLVDYLRKAFTGEVNNTRITLDSEIRSTELELDLFASPEWLVPIQMGHFAVLEIKSTGELPKYVKKYIEGYGRSSRAVSKYRESRWLMEELNVI